MSLFSDLFAAEFNVFDETKNEASQISASEMAALKGELAFFDSGFPTEGETTQKKKQRREFKRPFIAGMKPMRESRTFCIAAFDTETIGLNGELTLATCYHEDWAENEAKVFQSASELLEAIFALPEKTLKKTIWFAHNAEYDWRYLLPLFEQYKDQYIFQPIERAENKWFQITVIDKESGETVTKFRDSMALFPGKLADFTKQFSPEYEKHNIGLDAGVLFDKENPIHVAYAINDVISLTRALQRFDQLLFQNFQVHMRGTISSTSYQAWLRTIPLDKYHDRIGIHAETFMRECYKGGLVFLNCRAGDSYERVETFDINSSYPSQMRKGVPTGRPIWHNKYKPGFPGFYYAKIRAPKIPVGILHHTENKRLMWPVNCEFETYLTSVEYDYAKKIGYKIEVIKGFYFPQIEFIFADFVDKCEKLRREFKGQALEQVVKLLQNSLYGKFGTRKDGRRLIIDFDNCPEGHSCCVNSEDGSLVENLYFMNEERDGEFIMPHWAAWITAHGRVQLHSTCKQVGWENVLYGDTDSITTESGTAKPDVGIVYGQWKYEGEKFDWRGFAPKFYSFAKKPGGKIESTCKGIPKSAFRSNPDLAEALHAGERIEVEYASTTNVMTFLRTGERQIMRKRRPTDSANISAFTVEGGKFVPRKPARGEQMRWNL